MDVEIRRKMIIYSVSQILISDIDWSPVCKLNASALQFLRVLHTLVLSVTGRSKTSNGGSRPITNFPDIHFKEHFRMEKPTFEALLTILSRTENPDQCKKQYVLFSTQLLIVLWILATPDSFGSVGERFNVSKGTAHYIYVVFIRKFASLRGNFIKWPSRQEIRQLQETEKKSNFPGIVGFIDGTYINIKAPREPTRYFNRKKTTALILQGVCDSTMKFIDVYFGEVGSLHDNRVYTRSPLHKELHDDPVKYVGVNGHILGDAAYMLSCTLMTPYKDNGHLTDEETLYNRTHSKIRSTIERAFALLKGKWRRLKFLDASILEYMRDHVLACCVLHNFLLQMGDNSLATESTAQIEQGVIDAREETEINLLNVAAQRKRNNIAAILYYKEFCQ